MGSWRPNNGQRRDERWAVVDALYATVVRTDRALGWLWSCSLWPRAAPIRRSQPPRKRRRPPSRISSRQVATRPDERDTVELDGLAEGADDVFVQIGQYELGNNIDEFVWGPLLVAYRDGSAFAEVDETVVDGVAERRPIEALLDPAQIDSIRQAADALPDDAEIGLDQRAEDAIPRMLIVDDQTWLIHDLSAEPFRSFMESVTEAVEATESTNGLPSVGSNRDRSTGQCSVTQAPSGPSYYNAPVYPHLLDQYPLGDFDCSS